MRLRAVFAALALTAFLAGCAGSPIDPTAGERNASLAPPTTSAAVPRTPEKVVLLLVASLNHLDFTRYSEVLTDDYRFFFAVTDSAGNTSRGFPLTREDDLEITHHMFVNGTATLPPARRIRASLGHDLVDLADPRPGKNPGWHRLIQATAEITLDNGIAVYHVSGAFRFYVVRGDSAQIPPELVARGFGPDPGRWWIERWDDETLPAPASPQDAPAAGPRSWAEIKLLYR